MRRGPVKLTPTGSETQGAAGRARLQSLTGRVIIPRTPPPIGPPRRRRELSFLGCGTVRAGDGNPLPAEGQPSTRMQLEAAVPSSLAGGGMQPGAAGAPP